MGMSYDHLSSFRDPVERGGDATGIGRSGSLKCRVNRKDFALGNCQFINPHTRITASGHSVVNVKNGV